MVNHLSDFSTFGAPKRQTCFAIVDGNKNATIWTMLDASGSPPDSMMYMLVREPDFNRLTRCCSLPQSRLTFFENIPHFDRIVGHNENFLPRRRESQREEAKCFWVQRLQ